MTTENGKMYVKNSVYEAIQQLGGATQVSFLLRVNSQTVHAWVRKGYVPSFEKAKKLARASGINVEDLRKQGGRGLLSLGRF